MSDILIPSLFVGILLAFVYVNLYLAASFIELKNNPEARLKLNPKVVFLSVLLIYPLVSVVTLLIGFIYSAINNLIYYYLFCFCCYQSFVQLDLQDLNYYLL